MKEEKKIIELKSLADLLKKTTNKEEQIAILKKILTVSKNFTFSE